MQQEFSHLFRKATEKVLFAYKLTKNKVHQSTLRHYIQYEKTVFQRRPSGGEMNCTSEHICSKNPYIIKETLVLRFLMQYTKKEQLVRKYISVGIRKRMINIMELDHNSHSVFLLYYHLVMVIKYRRKVLNDEISERAKEIFEYIAPQ